MRSIELDLKQFGHLARRSDLIALGHSASQIRTRTTSGEFLIPRKGWLASSAAPPEAVRAIILGGRLGGSSALNSYGVWAGTPSVLVVATSRTSSRLTALGPNEVRIWKDDKFPSSSDRMFRVSLRDAILQHARATDRAEVIATIDSALHHGLLPIFDLAELLAVLPTRVRPCFAELDVTSMAGTESLMRVELRAFGYQVTSQASIRHVGQVDLLVDGWFIVECDSRRYHDGESQQRVDRKRDGEAALAKFGSARFTYAQVMFEREWCLAVVAAGLERGRP